MSRNTKLSILVAAALAGGGSAAYAAKTGAENDAMAITAAKVSLAQAVTAAEQHVKGRAARAEYEHSKHGWVYDVEVVTGTKVFDVKVDANKGTVIASAEDKMDSDDEHDEKD